MKASTLLAIIATACLPSAAFAQGDLQPPPGPPAPTMKTLDQIEARTPISSAPYTISASGSYYLTDNVSVTEGDAITIASDHVTLDLNGFTISSTANPAGGNGIFITAGRKNISIKNGTIAGGVTYSGGNYGGPGFQSGIEYQQYVIEVPENVRLSGVSVSGCSLFGIHLPPKGSLVDSCSVTTVGSFGIVAATVSKSHVQYARNGGISADIVSNCQATITGSGNAIFASSLADNCSGDSATGTGVQSAGVAVKCRGRSAGAGAGVQADSASDCWGESVSGQGILTKIATNCHGSSVQNRGISTEIATGCYGTSAGGSFGLIASRIATASHGFSESGTGLSAHIANTCTGATNSGTALSATYKYNMP